MKKMQIKIPKDFWKGIKLPPNWGKLKDEMGKYTMFGSGAIRDSQEGKVDFTETISWTAFNAYAKYMTSKSTKYGSGNFKKGIPDESYTKSLLRHIDKHMRNTYENGNDEKDEDHLSAIVFNALGLIHNREQLKLIKK